MVFPRPHCFDSASSEPSPTSLQSLHASPCTMPPSWAPLRRLRLRLRTRVLPCSGPCFPPGRGLGCALCLCPLALWALVRACPQWAHQAALVSGDIKFSTLSCHCHPQAASAAAWLNYSSGFVYPSLLGCEWLSKPHTAPSQVQLPWPPSPLQLGHRKAALGLGHVQLFRPHLAGVRVNIGTGG